MFSHKSYLKIGSHEGTDFLSLAKSGYELSNCSFSLQQGIDNTGNAVTDVFGGTMSLELPMLPSDEIIEWSLNSKKYHKGCVIVLDAENMPVERILFENAACVSMGVDYTLSGEHYASTRIVIHAERLIFGNGLDFDNFWIKH